MKRSICFPKHFFLFWKYRINFIPGKIKQILSCVHLLPLNCRDTPDPDCQASVIISVQMVNCAHPEPTLRDDVSTHLLMMPHPCTHLSLSAQHQMNLNPLKELKQSAKPFSICPGRSCSYGSSVAFWERGSQLRWWCFMAVLCKPLLMTIFNFLVSQQSNNRKPHQKGLEYPFREIQANLDKISNTLQY